MTLDPSDCFILSIFPQNWVPPTHKSQHLRKLEKCPLPDKGLLYSPLHSSYLPTPDPASQSISCPCWVENLAPSQTEQPAASM